MKTEERIEGALLGLATGNALGAPLEFLSASQIPIKHGTVRTMLGGGWRLSRPGQWTPDTALALLLGRSLVERGGLDEADVARRYAEWFRTHPRDVTGALRTALALLAEGAPAPEAAGRARELSGEDAAGSGTLSRAVPIALRFADLRYALAAADREAAITHADPRPRAASAAMAAILGLLVAGVPREEVFDRAWETLEEDPGGPPNVLPDVPSRAARALRPGGDAVDVLEVAVWHFLRAPTFEDAVVGAANLGGDADTTAGLAGALAGAAWGPDSIPRPWLRALAERAAIRGLARDLAAGRGGSGQGRGGSGR